MDRSPHWGRERAVKKEVTEGFRDPTGQETPAQETVSVIRTAAETNMADTVMKGPWRRPASRDVIA